MHQSDNNHNNNSALPFLPAVSEFPARPAIITGNLELTWNQLGRLIESYRIYSVLKNQAMAVPMNPDVESIAIWFARLAAGLFSVPLNGAEPVEFQEKMAKLCGLSILDKSDLKGDSTGKYLQTTELGQNQLISGLMTSGSTGSPKTALLTYGNWYYSAKGLLETVDLDSTDKYLLTLPLNHAGGLSILMRAALSGCAIVIPDSDKSISENLLKHQITHISMVPAQLNKILDSGKTFPNLKMAMVGGASLNLNLAKNAKDANIPLFFSYGMTETAGAITLSHDFSEEGDIPCSGKILPYRKLRISDNDMIEVCGLTLFQSYMNEENITSDGWWNTGDFGFLKNERLFVQGRAGKIFISGGENVDPVYLQKLLSEIIGCSIRILVVDDAIMGNRYLCFTRDILSDELLLEKFFDLKSRLPRHLIPLKLLNLPVLSDSNIKISDDQLKKYIL